MDEMKYNWTVNAAVISMRMKSLKVLFSFKFVKWWIIFWLTRKRERERNDLMLYYTL